MPAAPCDCVSLILGKGRCASFFVFLGTSSPSVGWRAPPGSPSAGRSCLRRRLRRLFARQALRRGGVSPLFFFSAGRSCRRRCRRCLCVFCTPSPSAGWRASLGPSQGWASGVSVCVWASAWGAVAVVVVCVFCTSSPSAGWRAAPGAFSAGCICRRRRRRRLCFFARQALRWGGVLRLALPRAGRLV